MAWQKWKTLLARLLVAQGELLNMQIRKLTHDDLPRASAMCLDAFMLAVAPSLSAQGVDTFVKVVAAQAFAERMEGDNLMLVCVSDGVIELKQGCHVAMLFVAPGWVGLPGPGMQILGSKTRLDSVGEGLTLSL